VYYCKEIGMPSVLTYIMTTDTVLRIFVQIFIFISSL